MDEAVLLPSPNWFLVSCMAVSTDGWVIYGGPSKSICVLEPLASDRNVLVGQNGYRTHFFGKVHGDKVTAVDICPAWFNKKSFITGSADGIVKLWHVEKVDNTLNIKYTYNHSMHSNEREDVVGVGYSTNNFAITVGSFGRIVKWDLLSNIVKTYNFLLAKFKPTCIACSPHECLQVAVGTKQGVVIVVDLNGTGNILFKVRSNDDEVLSVSWCPQYVVTLTKVYKELESKNTANKRMEKLRQEASYEQKEQLDDSALTKTLPDDSFDETIVEEDDLFDMYKDHEDDEFGHKKYTPEVIVVKEEKTASTEFDYLAECEKLKDQILKNKEEPEPSINSLVEALEKTHVDDNNTNGVGKTKPKKKEIRSKFKFEYKAGYKHLLATIGKHGHLRVWTTGGRLLGNTIITNKSASLNKYQQKVNQPPWCTLLWYKPDVLLITDARGQLLQCNPLLMDCRSKLDTSLVDIIHKRGTYCIISNAPRVQYGYHPEGYNQVDSGNQSQFDNESQGNLYGMVDQENDTQVVIPEDQWYVWTAAQDRLLVCYSLAERKKISSNNTCGGFVYNIQTCPYDAKKMAVCVGDGAIRVWEMDIADDNDEKLTYGHVTTFWQNVQGKVLITAWHPTRENILAFGTAESRVGILDISGHNSEKPARVINVGVSGAVYSVCWGERNELYVCGGGDIMVCHFKKDGEQKTISVKIDGEKWRLTAVSWYPFGIMCGSFNGSVALLSNVTHEILAFSFLFKKLINCIELHPQFTSSSNEESSFKNLMAVCSMDRSFKIAILKHDQNEEGKHQLETYKYLEGHKGNVMQLAWSPHDEGRLASTSSDCTVRVWDIESATCTAIFSGHTQSPITVAWSAFPQLSNVLVTGGSDYCVRLWKLEDYPPENYKEMPIVTFPTKKERKMRALAEKTAEERKVSEKHEEATIETENMYGGGREADQMAIRLRAFKKFLLPISSKQMIDCTALATRKLAQKYMVNEEDKSGDECPEMHYDTDFLKMFGTTNELNELLDAESEYHLQANDTDGWIMLAIFRGQMDAMIQFASENDLLCPFLISLSPCVSFKYWKDATQLYLAQINRFVAQKREHKLLHNRSYGGPVFRKVALLLSVHDVKGAVECLLEARLFRDAYVLCRARHMESIARETLWLWIRHAISNGHLKMAIICYIVLGEYYKASTTIAGVAKDDETWLSLAADLAKMAGQHTYAGHLEGKKEQIKQTPNNQETEEEILEQLPSRIELFLRNNGTFRNVLKDENGEKRDLEDEEGVENDLKHENCIKKQTEDIETKE